jgi:SSS family solute:Na+ symporter
MVTDPVTGKANVDKLIPTFIQSAMPEWFGYLFMLTLLAAAMSTLSAQFHVIGTAYGRDLYQQVIAKGGHQERTVPIAKAGILVGFIVTVVLALQLGTSIVAIATALFFGLCAAAFLPLFVAALFWKRANRFGAIAGMLSGTFAWALWVLFFHETESGALGLCPLLFGRSSLVAGTTLAAVDPSWIALPISGLVTVVATLVTKPDVRAEPKPAPSPAVA